MKTELTKEELKELIGGDILHEHKKPEIDIENINKYSGCVCTYNNQAATINKNTIDHCSCQCV